MPTQPLADRVEAALRAVRDPEADLSVFDAGLVENVVVEDGQVTVEAALDGLDPNTTEEVVNAVLHAVDGVEGVDGVTVERTARSTGDGEAGTVGDFETVIAVASAKGGVGKSTVAAHLACALAEGDSGEANSAAAGDDGDDADAEPDTDADPAGVGLFDADVHGPNAPQLLEVSGPVHSSEDGRPLPIRSGPLEVMSVGLMEDGAPLAWRGAMAHDALSELFAETAWSNDDTLVIDLPPGTGDVVLTTLQEVPVDAAVVVTTPFHASVSDTRRTVELFRDNGIPVLGAVVNMREVICECCGEPNALFDGDALADLGTDPLVELPFTEALQGTPTPGNLPEPALELGEAVEAALETAGEVDVADDALDIRGLDPEARRERVAEAFGSVEPGEAFVIVSDRDPAPVRPFLADVAGVRPAAFDVFDVRRATPDDWVLRVVRPEARQVSESPG